MRPKQKQALESAGQNDLLSEMPFPLAALVMKLLASADDVIVAKARLVEAVPTAIDRELGCTIIDQMWPRQEALVKLHADEICSLVYRDDRAFALSEIRYEPLRAKVRAEVERRFMERKKGRENGP